MENNFIKGWVARCKWSCPEELYLYFGDKKPVRSGRQVEEVGEDWYWDNTGGVTPLPKNMFPEITWESEPVEVKVILKVEEKENIQKEMGYTMHNGTIYFNFGD